VVGELKEEPNGELIGELRLLLKLERTGLVGFVLILIKGLLDKSFPLLVRLLLKYIDDDELVMLLTERCLELVIPKLEKEVFFSSSLKEKVLVRVNIGLLIEVVDTVFILF
jgi:hypothetical protein